MDKLSNITLDQKLKALEIAVKMLGPLKIADDDDAKDTEIDSTQQTQHFLHYKTIAALVLKMALDVEVSAPA